jgi:hypothetical protein
MLLLVSTSQILAEDEALAATKYDSGEALGSTSIGIDWSSHPDRAY